MKFITLLVFAFLTIGCATPPTVSAASAAEHPEAKPYDKARDAKADVAATLAQAAAQDKPAIIVMGANWCHDSRALAGWFETPRFASLLSENFVVTYVDVGKKARNQDIAEGFGLDGTPGTPTVVVTDADGNILNLDTAPTWRNAASRSEDEIYDYFEGYIGE